MQTSSTSLRKKKKLSSLAKEKEIHGPFWGWRNGWIFVGITMASNHPGIIPYMQAIPVMAWAIATLVVPLTETNSGALDAQVRIAICQIWVRMREWEWFTHCHDDYIYIHIYISSKKSCFRSKKPEPPQLINSSAARCHSQEAPLQNFRSPHPFYITKIWPNIPNLRAGGLFTCCY